MAERLTDRDLFLDELSDGDLIHFVDVSDPTDTPQGTSFKLQLTTLRSYLFKTAIIVAHPGGGQSSATQLDAYDNLIGTVANTGDSVKTISAITDRRMKIRNKGANSLNLYPQAGQQCEGYSATDPISIDAGNSIEIVCFDDGTWTL